METTTFRMILPRWQKSAISSNKPASEQIAANCNQVQSLRNHIVADALLLFCISAIEPHNAHNKIQLRLPYSESNRVRTIFKCTRIETSQSILTNQIVRLYEHFWIICSVGVSNKKSYLYETFQL